MVHGICGHPNEKDPPMKNIIFTGMAALLTLSGCASIVSKSDWPISVNSNPSDMSFTITDKSGKVITKGKTPQTVTLASGESYFSREQYTIAYMKDGKQVEQSLTPSINGWYWGNILFGGLIGLLIVDPLTGAMYKLPKNIELGVTEVKSSSNTVTKPELHIVDINQLTLAQRAQLVPLN